MALRYPMIYPILRWQRAPVLVATTMLVTEFNGRLTTLVQDMFATLYAAPGVGLAAPQIGASISLAVIDITVGKDPCAKLVLVNPKVVAMDGCATEQEGCLSIPGYRECVTRPARVTVEYQDLTGFERTLTADGLLARAVQHECDHLQGELIVDRISSLKRSMIERKVRRLMKLGRW